MNENTFPQPHEFKPERWIGDDGKLITPPLDYMPFGVGMFYVCNWPYLYYHYYVYIN